MLELLSLAILGTGLTMILLDGRGIREAYRDLGRVERAPRRLRGDRITVRGRIRREWLRAVIGLFTIALALYMMGIAGHPITDEVRMIGRLIVLGLTGAQCIVALSDRHMRARTQIIYAERVDAILELEEYRLRYGPLETDR